MKCVFDLLGMLLGGALFGYGLAYSGMVSPEVVLKFLTLQDFGLMLVMGGAIGVTVVAYQLLPRLRQRPLLAEQFEKRVTPLNKSTLLGAVIFGLGWGVSGVCPGPAIAGLGGGNLKLLWSLVGIVAGAYLQGWYASRASTAADT
jgi:uncharacterized membrane protein YedE/YeeE